MNYKASVSKELNAKHTKILEGLVKLPQNRECADCRSKAPRWASINLGIFICLQCSGIHRSLGVHISKVRSTTLDTWLPEQVSFMQSMGNERSNTYWEAELPPNFDRSDTQQFIHSKYQGKKWVSKTATQPIAIADKSSNNCKASGDIPKKARKYSLGEDFFSKQALQVVPPTKARAGSLDMSSKVIVSPTPSGLFAEPKVSGRSVDPSKDLFQFVYVSAPKQDRAVVPPSRWATFD